MKKILLAALCIAMAAPAFALDTSLNGFFRTKMYYYNVDKGKDLNDNQFVDQRFRAKATLTMNEYVSVVYYGEVDMVWGDNSYGIGGKTRNSGGGIGGDTVNIETKNLYATLKLPETPMGAVLGLQGYYDNFSGVVFIADMAGVKLAGKLGPVSGNVAYMKWQEGAFNQEDDVDLYATQLSFDTIENLSLGLDAYWMAMQAGPNGTNSLKWPPMIQAMLTSGGASINEANLYFVGPQVGYKMNGLDLSGWFLYEGGKATVDFSDGSDDDIDISSYAASVAGNFSLADVKIGARGMWFSSDDDWGDTDWHGLFIPTTGELGPFGDSGMMIFLGDPFSTTQVGPVLNGYAMDDAVYAGYGLLGLCVNGSYSPPAMKELYVKAAVGYFSATEDSPTDGIERDGKSLGTEVSGRIGIKIAKVADFSLNGAYAWYGDFYNNTVNGNEDPDNPWLTYAMLNVNY